jgi:hypothetical protein
MPELAVPAVEAAGVGAQQPLHPDHQVGLRCLYHQMKVIAHQAIGVHLPASLFGSLAEGGQKLPAVLIVRKNRFAPVTAIHQMVYCPRVLDAQFASHAFTMQKIFLFVNRT